MNDTKKFLFTSHLLDPHLRGDDKHYLYSSVTSTASKKKNPSITLKQKIGQMLMIGFKGTHLQNNDPIVQAIMQQQIGGVILFAKDMQTNQYRWNIIDKKQLKKLTSQLQHYARIAAEQHHNSLYPLLIAIDYEGGKINRLNPRFGFKAVPSQADTGKQNLKVAKKTAEQIAETLKSVGINFDFTPVIDVNSNPDNPIIGRLDRSFSTDPKQVTKFAAVYSQAFNQAGIQCAYKHFPGHGSSTKDTHKGMVDITDTWQASELLPYKQLLKLPYHCHFIMPGHLINRKLDANNLPASLSKSMLINLLRKKLNFQGIIISDDMQMKAITDHYGLNRALILAINAGNNIILYGNHQNYDPNAASKIVNLIYQDVISGKINEKRIDESFQRIFKLKKKLLIQP